jgi:hypothetical protein
MKKLILIVATWLTLSSCTKEASAPETQETSNITALNAQSAENVKATIRWTSDPAVDGFGWVLRISEEQVEIPKNLPESYKQDGLQVIVSYKGTNERFPCRCAQPKFYVEITSITPLNP